MKKPQPRETENEKPRPPEMEDDDVHNDRDGDEIDESDYVCEVTALYEEDDVAHEEEPEEERRG